MSHVIATLYKKNRSTIQGQIIPDTLHTCNWMNTMMTVETDSLQSIGFTKLSSLIEILVI